MEYRYTVELKFNAGYEAAALDTIQNVSRVLNNYLPKKFSLGREKLEELANENIIVRTVFIR